MYISYLVFNSFSLMNNLLRRKHKLNSLAIHLAMVHNIIKHGIAIDRAYSIFIWNNKKKKKIALINHHWLHRAINYFYVHTKCAFNFVFARQNLFDVGFENYLNVNNDNDNRNSNSHISQKSVPIRKTTLWIMNQFVRTFSLLYFPRCIFNFSFGFGFGSLILFNKHAWKYDIKSCWMRFLSSDPRYVNA